MRAARRCVTRPHPTYTRRPPRMRGIQYAAASRFNHCCEDRHCERSEAIHRAAQRKNGLLRGACHRARIRATRWLAMTAVLDAPSMATTADIISRSRDMNCPRFASRSPSLDKRGRREDRVRAAPAVSCAIAQKTRTRAYRSSGEHPAFPAQWFYGVLRALPGVRIPLATVIRGLMDGASPVGPAHPPRT
jgi:hypothetical protein